MDDILLFEEYLKTLTKKYYSKTNKQSQSKIDVSIFFDKRDTRIAEAFHQTDDCKLPLINRKKSSRNI